MNREDLLWSYQHEQRQIGSNMDQQRTAITNFTMTLTAGLVAVISVKGFDEHTVIIASFIIILGIYGVLTTRKLYERSVYHFTRSRICLTHLDSEISEGIIGTIQEASKTKTKEKYPIMHRVHNHQIWMFLHILIVFFGLIVLIFSIVVLYKAQVT